MRKIRSLVRLLVALASRRAIGADLLGIFVDAKREELESGRMVSNCRTVSCHLSKKVKRPREAKVSAMSSIEVCRSPMNLRSKVSTSRT